jgi:hypothetical protein
MTNTIGFSSEQDRDPELFLSSIKHLSCEEFDGHTDFEHLCPDDKLHWLSEIARFFYENRTGRESNE